jgi:hypothetical protein
MTNKDRLLEEVKNITLSNEIISIYLLESGLNGDSDYDPTSKSNLKQIYKTTVAILESIANDPASMKDYKQDDISVSAFHENLQSRIEYLNRKIRQLPDDNDVYNDGGSVIYLFKK